ncbi:MAG: SMC family ATPase [Acidimicrobiia bacterium]
MRPERLVLKGFGAFRQYTEIDFAGVELFALIGPTGSGKTTVLDGICFALYGSVPRHGRRDVAPVVTQGLTESAVSLAFSVGDDHYAVARHVRKDSKRKTANTDEATLEKGGEVLATGADAVTAAVVALLGLDFEQFTTCVLLPQGEFQRFLHDKPANRQNLLSALLDLGIYERIGQRASERRERAGGQLATIDQRLAALGTIDASYEESAAATAAALTTLLTEVERVEPELIELAAAGRAAEAEAERTRNWHKLLGQLSPPESLESMAGERPELAEMAAEIVTAQTEIAARITAAEEVIAALPSSKDLSQWSAARTDVLVTDQEAARARTSVSEARAVVEKAGNVLVATRTSLQEAMDQNRAAHLRRSLEPGHRCPVCDQTVTTLPPPLVESKVDKARSSMEKAEKEVDRCTKAATAAENLLLRLEERLEGLRKLTLESPPEAELPAIAQRLAAADDQLRKARKDGESTKRRHDEVEQARTQLADRERSAMRELQNARDRLAGLDPPPLTFEDPAIDWKTLIAWAADQAAAMAGAETEAEVRRAEAAARLAVRVGEINSRFDALDIRIGDRPIRDLAVDALTQATARLDQIQRARLEASGLTIERLSTSSHQEVAALLVRLLRNDAFRNWLLDEVFAALVTGANIRLSDLTKGQYSLDMAGRDFEVIDNLSAGNRRSVRTLSGGETFLVSLGLALALADQVTETSVGSARLESIFLDEGFGTLDAETLDVVGSVISELGASGKTVGIVTHVAELAEQMPVRYEIRKSADGATVTEVRQ